VGVLMKHLQEEPPLGDAAATSIPPGVREVVRRALAKDRDARYASARELADDLRAARAAPEAAPAVSTVTAAPRPAPPRPPPTSAAARATARTAPPAPPPPVVTPPRPAPAVPGIVNTPAARSSRRALWAVGLLGLAVSLPAGGWLAYRAIQPDVSPSPPPASLITTTDTLATAPPRESATPSTTLPSPAETPLPGYEFAARACEAGQPGACTAAGQRHETGDGALLDERRAAALYRRACDLGAAHGCTRLGILHNSGRGVVKDVATASELYEKACSGGDAPGCNNLGTMYEFGVIGFAPDAVRAAGYYRDACDRGDPQGCGNLGAVSLGQGRASRVGRDEAVRLLRQGCASAFPRACRTLQQHGISP
jgi:hypothetical protein